MQRVPGTVAVCWRAVQVAFKSAHAQLQRGQGRRAPWQQPPARPPPPSPHGNKKTQMAAASSAQLRTLESHCLCKSRVRPGLHTKVWRKGHPPRLGSSQQSTFAGQAWQSR